MKRFDFIVNTREEAIDKQNQLMSCGIYTVVSDWGNKFICYTPKESYTLDDSLIVKGMTLFYKDNSSVVIEAISSNGVCLLSNGKSVFISELSNNTMSRHWDTLDKFDVFIKDAFNVKDIYYSYFYNKNYRNKFLASVFALFFCILASPVVAKLIGVVFPILADAFFEFVVIGVLTSLVIFCTEVKNDLPKTYVIMNDM